MKLADYVIQYLADLGIHKVFVVYGAACADLIDAFTRIKNIEYVAVMHEQSGAFAAETYAKVSGGLGVAIATSGPGGINLLNGIANCYYDSTPCIFITGQVNSQFLRKDPSIRQTGFQENDIVSMAKPITKMAVMLKDAADVKRVLDTAAHLAVFGRPGPVLIDIPMDVQKTEVDFLRGTTPEGFIPNNTEAINEFIEDFKKAERPVLLVGGGVRLAKTFADIRRLGATLKIPCFPTWNAVDIITSDYEYYGGRVGTYGGPGRNFAIQNSDLLLAIGTRISGRITGGFIESFARGAKKYIVDVDEANLKPELQEVKGDVNICCDAKEFTQMLLKELKQHEWEPKDDWLNKAIEWRDKYQPRGPSPIHYNLLVDPPDITIEKCVSPYVFMKILSQELNSKDTIIADCGGNVVVTFQAFETKLGQRLISSHGNSTMGFSFAGAIGACFVPGVKRVICLIGDGGFNMNIQELQTVKNYGLSIKTFIMNNHIYGIARAFQDTHFESRREASGPKGYSPPDFVKIAEAYGIKTETIKSFGELRRKIRKVINCPGAVVCDVDMGEWSCYEPRISGWKTPIEDMTPLLPREEFRNNMIVEPVEGWDGK